ncbi:hypothetical protein PG991_006057 [Apiospora marii]|uniref:Uncharacterized protein n=1 Tax=Apiospora marii TaxID=335849 RepID=A0ABR1SAY6_9PEZI
MASPTRYEAITGRNIIAGVHNQGTFTVNYNEPRSPPICRFFPFPPNEEFVERPHITPELDRLLPASSSYHSAALWGLGGSGSDMFGFLGSCRQRDLIHPSQQSDRDKTRPVERFRRRKHLTSYNLSLFGVRPTSQRIRLAQPTAQKVNLLDYLPRGPTGTVLWTSRDSQASSLVGRQRAIHMDRMTSQEAETLMQMARNKNIDTEEAGATHILLAELYYLPLAISQAAAYIYRTSMPIEKYLSEIRERKKRWKALRRSEHNRYRGSEVSNSIFETWAMSIDYLQRA